jgi:hypothetical protein
VGVEFVGCDFDRPTVRGVAQRVRAVIEEAPHQLGPQTVALSASVGFAHSSDGFADISELIAERRSGHAAPSDHRMTAWPLAPGDALIAETVARVTALNASTCRSRQVVIHVRQRSQMRVFATWRMSPQGVLAVGGVGRLTLE